MKFTLSFALTTILAGTALAGRDKPKPTKCEPTTVTSISTVTVTVTPTTTSATSCETPTASATYVGQIEPPAWPTSGPEYEGLVFGSGWGHIACEQYCSSSCGPGTPTCDPSCSNKGTCGFSNKTNLYIGGHSGQDPQNPGYTIEAKAPATSFSIPLIFLTSGETDFVDGYPYINFEVRSWDKFGNQRPTQNFVIPRPPSTWYHTDIRLDLLNLGIVDVGKIEFLPFQEGSIGGPGQGPDGRILANVKIDGDGYGGPIPYQVFTPLC
ncbi:hypothetical protein BDZ91DRAFT_725242 [Kalaharituber pfeilii]|nr:hypothetical protein BDZ91DRAFT_725242 [Kalaharituber pfeilii]